MRKILIVEDDNLLLEIYQKKFLQVGYKVETAQSGAEVLEKIKSNDFDLVLLDLIIPNEDGFQVLEKIKKDPEVANSKVIIFSNLSQQEEKDRAKHLGADGFITKSDFTPTQLVEKVESFLINQEQVEKTPEDLGFETKHFAHEGKLFGDEDDFEEKIEQEKQEEQEDSFFDDQKKDPKALGKSILMVEDEDVFSEVFGKKLSGVGYALDIAKNGAWGLRYTDEKVYDLIILDIVMPALHGIEAIEQIRKGEKNSETPIIIFSNSVDDFEMEKQALEKGANAFLVKTRITPSQLVEEVKKLI